VPLVKDAPSGASPLVPLSYEQRPEAHADRREFAPGAEEEQARLADQVVELIDQASSVSPVLLVLDDLQWADRALQSLLFRILAQERPRRWAVGLAARSDEPGGPVPILPTTVDRIELGPLSDRDARALAQATLGNRRLKSGDLSAIVERSAGNPFFAVELTRQATLSEVGVSLNRRRVPEAIIALLRDRVGRCSPTARRIVPLIALAGAEASHELLVSVGGDRVLAGSPERAVRAIDELIRAHLIVETSAGVRLTHPLLRAAALAEVNALRRGALHSLLADRLEVACGDAETIAQHRLAAFEAGRLRGRAAAAARAGFLAGRTAREMLAYDAALELLEGGLAAFEAAPAEERGALRGGAVSAWLDRADILFQRDEESDGRAACESALALATTDKELARAWRSLGEIPYRHGDMAGATNAYRRGLEALHGDKPLPRALLLCDLGWALHRMGRYEEALGILEEAYQVLDREGGPADAGYCADAVAITLSALGRRGEALSLSDEALRLGELAGTSRLQALQHLHRAQILSGLGRFDEAIDHARQAGTVYDLPRDRYKLSIVHWVIAEVLDALGDLHGALEQRDAESALLLEVGNELNMSRAEAHRAQLLTRLGRRREAKLAAASAREAAALVGDGEWSTRVEGWLAGGKISGRAVP
jgi:tetratricopeptide (TPR) repeat protein